MYNFWQYAMYRFNIILTISFYCFQLFLFFLEESFSVVHAVTISF